MNGYEGSTPSGANMSKTLDAINSSLEQTQSSGHRNHLGGSIIGKPCARQLWYVFHWAKKSYHKGRILRLFNRGHREEPAIVDNLRSAGIHTLDIDPETGEQFRILDHDGHFGGSLDALLYDSPEFPGDWILGEFKTHNNKSFTFLTRKGLKTSKYEHYVQTQIYMHYKELPAALYFAVNKDNDAMEVQVVLPEPEVAERYIDRAHMIINIPDAPERMKNASPGWFECKWCDYIDICHHSAAKEMNCRTCVSASPVANAEWNCDKHNVIISTATQKQGCQSYREIPE